MQLLRLAVATVVIGYVAVQRNLHVYLLVLDTFVWHVYFTERLRT